MSGLQNWLSLGGAVGGICAGFAAYWSKLADRQTKAVGNGFANHVMASLDDIVRRLERLEQK